MNDILLKDVIQYIIMVIGFAGVIASQRIWISQLQHAVFNEDGSHRFMGCLACDRKHDLLSGRVDGNLTLLRDDLQKLNTEMSLVKEQATIHNITDANRWGDIIVCLHTISDKVDVTCRSIKSKG